MHLSDEEEYQDEDSESVEDEDLEQTETESKRKLQHRLGGPLKKIKYEDIISEKSNKKSKNDLYKPPTVEELNELKETQNLYNNNLFRLQIEELINEVKIKNKHKNAFATWFQSFEKFLNELPEYTIPLSEIKVRNKKKLTDEDRFVNDLASQCMKCDQDFPMKFMKPEMIQLFGLEKNNALPGPSLCLNINLKMPRACFNVKDYLNNRYFVKRYYFLSYISYFLKMKELCSEIQWISYNSNKLLPTLQIKLKNSEKIVIKILATPTDNYFKPSRFLPDMNNVKVNVFDCGNITEAPTLFYNSSMAHDVALSTNNLFIEKCLSELPNVQEAIKLIYIWLVQRELNIGLGSFNEDLIPYFIVYLAIKKRINKHMSSYQVVRNFWNFLYETDLTSTPVGICEDQKNEVFENFTKNYDVVFLDRTGCYNVTSFLNINVYKKIKIECALAFKLLDDGGINSFHSLFITKLPTELQYDLILNLTSQTKFDNITNLMSDEERTKFLGHPEHFIIKHIYEILQRGLNKRATLIVPFVDSSFTKISFGINLDPTQAFNYLELGPALNDPKEKEFRDFWGHLSSDRRFKDGSICVAVYFQTETIKDRRDIIKTIINWIALNKLRLEYKLQYDDFDSLLVNKKVSASYPMGTNEECCLRAITASDELGKKLRALEMPLAITSVQGISDTYSFTETFPPISTNYICGGKITSTLENNIILKDEKKIGLIPRYVKPIECVLQLEHSSKWPKDLHSIRNMKTVFFLEIAKQLMKHHQIVSSVKPEFIEVLYEGFVFRYRLYLSREVGLLKKESTSNGITVYKDTPESREMEKKLNVLPKLTGALKGLQSQHPSYGPATALIKRWLRAHLIDNHHFPDDVINLLSASLYLNQSAFLVPCTPQGGFLRFLKFFSELQYEIQPVVVNFNDEITKETIAEIDSKLLQNREACPNLFIAMPYDDCESSFTKTAPSKEVLRRVKQLAGETLKHFSSIVKEESLIKVRDLFVPNLEGYNVIIHLRPLLNPVRHEGVTSDDLESQINLPAFNHKESTKIPVVDFNPVQLYLKELRHNYGDFAHFFHDTYGGNIIGVLWTPKALEDKEFKVSHVDGRKLVNDKLVLNIDGLVEDFYILGRGLVKSIDKR